MRRKLFIFIIFIFGFIFPSFAKERLFIIKAKKFQYTPNIIKVNYGDTVRIRLISEDVTHGFFLDGYGLETRAHPGQDGSLVFVANKRGKFNFRCSVTCGEFHPYMVGYLVVEPNKRYGFFFVLTVIAGIGAGISIFKKRS